MRPLVAGLRWGEFAAFGVHVAQRQKGHEVIRVERRELVEIHLRGFGIAHLAREISHRAESSRVGGRKLQGLPIHLDRFRLAVHLPKQVGVVQDDAGAVRLERHRLFQIFFGGLRMVESHFHGCA